MWWFIYRFLCISTRLERWCSQKIELISFNKKILALNVKVAILESKLLFLTSYIWPKYTFNELNSIFWHHHRSYGVELHGIRYNIHTISKIIFFRFLSHPLVTRSVLRRKWPVNDTFFIFRVDIRSQRIEIQRIRYKNR